MKSTLKKIVLPVLVGSALLLAVSTVHADCGSKSDCGPKSDCGSKSDCGPKSDCDMKSDCATETASTKAKPTAVGLIFHADWCGSCKVMDPKIKEARAALSDEQVLFIVLDHTDETSTRQATMLAESLGFGDIFRERGGKTGTMLLVNTGTGKVVETVTREDTPESIQAKARKAKKG